MIGLIKHWLLWNLKVEERDMKAKFTYNTTWQIPLFDEQDDGRLIPHMQEKMSQLMGNNRSCC